MELKPAQTQAGRDIDETAPRFEEVRFWDTYGEPCTLGRWTELQEDRDEPTRRVAFDVFGDVSVSTAWWGLDLGFHMGGPPLIFETMIFGGEHDGRQQRYPTRDAAARGHWVMCVRFARNDPSIPLPAKVAHQRRYTR